VVKSFSQFPFYGQKTSTIKAALPSLSVPGLAYMSFGQRISVIPPFPFFPILE